MLKKLIILAIFSSLSMAKVLVSPIDVMKEIYPQNNSISKKNTILTTDNAKKVQSLAKVKLKSKIFRYFTAKKGNKILGYGILINRKVRSKNAVTLYCINSNGILKSIEIIAFNEPLEFMPNKTWSSQFNNIPYNKKLQVGKNIPTITGATLTARSLVDGSRIASAFYEVVLKAK